jgi:acyl-CoA thioesterase I
MRILFQGDSITDCDRDRNDPAGLGFGYAALVAALAHAQMPEAPFEFLNRGISGNRVYDLEARWKEDCLDLKPDIVSILIGINDTWRRYDSNLPSPVEEFEASLDRICAQVVATEATLILLEPFVLPVPKDRIEWREDLDPRIQAIRRVATTHQATLVPLDGVFAAAATKKDAAFWAADGVHPTLAGHALIAREVSAVLGM